MRARHKPRCLCPGCGYDITAMRDLRCPECGLPFSQMPDNHDDARTPSAIRRAAFIELPIAVLFTSLCAWNLATYFATGSMPLFWSKMGKPAADWRDVAAMSLFVFLGADFCLQRALFLMKLDRHRAGGYLFDRAAELLNKLISNRRSAK